MNKEAGSVSNAVWQISCKKKAAEAALSFSACFYEIFSMIPAMPCPPPTQAETIPYFLLSPFHIIGNLNGKFSACTSQRMTQCNSTTVDIHDLRVEFQFTNYCQRL